LNTNVSINHFLLSKHKLCHSSNTQLSKFGRLTVACFLVATPNFIPTETKVSSDLALFARRSSSISIASCKITPRLVVGHTFGYQSHIVLAMLWLEFECGKLSFLTKRNFQDIWETSYRNRQSTWNVGDCQRMTIFDIDVQKSWRTRDTREEKTETFWLK